MRIGDWSLVVKFLDSEKSKKQFKECTGLKLPTKINAM